MKIASTLPAAWPGTAIAAAPARRPQPLSRITSPRRDRRYELALALSQPASKRGRLLDVEA